MKKFLSLVLMALLCLTMIPVSASAEVVEIEMWTNMYDDVLPDLIAMYEAEHPEVKINLLTISFWDYGDKLNTALAAGTGPDIMVSGYDNNEMYVNAGQIVNISPLLEARGIDLNNGEFLQFTVDALYHDGSYWGLPLCTDTRLFYYNKDAFIAAGLDPEVPPKTWDEVLEYTKKLTTYDENGNIDVLGFNVQQGNFYPWTYLWTWGVDMIEDGKPVFNTETALEASKMALAIQDVYGYDNYLAFSENAATNSYDAFIAGDIAMVVSTHEYPEQIAKYNPDLNWGCAVIPTFDGETNHASWSSGFDLEFTDHGEERLNAAFDFGLFLISDEIQDEYFVKGFGAYSCNNSSRGKMAEFHPEFQADYLAALDASSEFTRLRDYLHTYPNWAGTLQSNWTLMMSGEMTPEDMLAESEKVINQEIENYNLFNG